MVPLGVKHVVISAESHVAAELNSRRPHLNLGDPIHVRTGYDEIPTNHADAPVQGSEWLCKYCQQKESRTRGKRRTWAGLGAAAFSDRDDGIRVIGWV